MLEFLRLPFSFTRDLFKDNAVFYIYLPDDETLEIRVERPSLSKTSLTWGTEDYKFAGTMDELREYLETLTASNVVPIR